MSVCSLDVSCPTKTTQTNHGDQHMLTYNTSNAQDVGIIRLTIEIYESCSTHKIIYMNVELLHTLEVFSIRTEKIMFGIKCKQMQLIAISTWLCSIHHRYTRTDTQDKKLTYMPTLAHFVPDSVRNSSRAQPRFLPPGQLSHWYACGLSGSAAACHEC
jgi:hypothetical protein